MAAQKVGKYALVEKIGQGGMGQIWLGRDEFGHEIAIKFLGNGLNTPQKGMRRFLREAATLSTLQHRNICRIHGIERSTGGTPVILMEFEKGVNLAQLLSHLSNPASEPLAPTAKGTQTDITLIVAEIEKGAKSSQKPSIPGQPGSSKAIKSETLMLPLQQTLALVIKVCDAVQYAHEHGVLHRDIKPSNVMIRRDGEPVLLDFGVAKFNEEASGPGLTGTGEMFGTIDYMAPEQVMSSKTVDERADVFSLGVILYELVVGQKYFLTSGNIIADAKRRDNYDPIRPRIGNRAIDKELEAVVCKAVALDPRHRYRSASQLKADLERYRQGLPVSATPPMPFYRAAKFVRRYRVATTLAAAVVLLAMLLGGTLAWNHYRQWGRWVQVCSYDFRAGADVSVFDVESGVSLNAMSQTKTDTAGMHTVRSSWYWLKNFYVRNNVRLVMKVVYTGILDGFELVINGVDEPREQWWNVPRGYSCQVGGYLGTMDFISINRKPGPPSLSNCVVSSVVSQRVHEVMFQREGNQISLFVDHKLKMQIHDNIPFSGREFGRIGFNSYARDVVVRSMDVYHQALPERASPLVVAEAFMSEQMFDVAFDRYISIANDYSGSTLGEKALVGAFYAASEQSESVRKAHQNLALGLLQRRYPNTKEWLPIGERQLVDDLQEGAYETVIARLPDFLRSYPESNIPRLLVDAGRAKSIPDSVFRALVPLLARGRTSGFLDLSRTGLQSLEGLGSLDLLGLDIHDNNISNLEPIAGGHLRFLSLDQNPIVDLQPLFGQPLRTLSMFRCANVKSLEPLENSPLVMLEASNTGVSEIPVFSRGMLKELRLNSGAGICDIEPLRGLDLEALMMDRNDIESIDALREMPLRRLALSSNKIVDFSPIKGMPLEALWVGGNPGTFDGSLVEGMPLHTFWIPRTKLSTAEFLANCPVGNLNVANSGLLNLSFARTMPLSQLNCSENEIHSIEPLRDLSLSQLNLDFCPVSTIEPLRGKQLDVLSICGTKVVSLDPIIETPPRILYTWGSALCSDSVQRAIAVWKHSPANDLLVKIVKTAMLVQTGQYQAARKNATTIDGVDYLLVPAKLTFAQGNSLAKAMGARLFLPTTRTQLSIVRNPAFNPADWVWMGRDVNLDAVGANPYDHAMNLWRERANKAPTAMIVNTQDELVSSITLTRYHTAFCLVQWGPL